MIVMTPRTQPLTTSSLSRRAALAGGAGLLGLGLAACSGASSSEEGDGDTITIGYMPSWTDTTVMAFLLKNQLEQLGNTVEFEEFTDAAIAYTALRSEERRVGKGRSSRRARSHGRKDALNES